MPDTRSWPARYKITSSLALLVALVFAGSIAAAAAASASTVPVVYAAHDDGWHAYAEPAAIYFGNGGAPYLTQVHWSSWNGTSAWATGKLWTQKPGCSPSYKCPYYSRWAGVYLNTIRWHNGTRYYARMAVEFWYAGTMRWDAGWFRGGFWAFPLVFPYF